MTLTLTLQMARLMKKYKSELNSISNGWQKTLISAWKNRVIAFAERYPKTASRWRGDGINLL